jgi:hypothetical protein
MAIYRRDIRQVAKKFEEKLTDLLWMCSREELQQFIIGYAKEQPDIHDALQNFLLPDVGSTGYPDYKKRVTQLLKAGQDDRGVRKGADDGLTSIVDELDRMIWKAERYAGKRQYKEALGITLTVMEQIALSVDNIYDHDGELVYTPSGEATGHVPPTADQLRLWTHRKRALPPDCQNHATAAKLSGRRSTGERTCRGLPHLLPQSPGNDGGVKAIYCKW